MPLPDVSRSVSVSHRGDTVVFVVDVYLNEVYGARVEVGIFKVVRNEERSFQVARQDRGSFLRLPDSADLLWVSYHDLVRRFITALDLPESLISKLYKDAYSCCHEAFEEARRLQSGEKEGSDLDYADLG